MYLSVSRRLLLMTFALTLVCNLYAQRTKTVETTYTYYVPGGQSINAAKESALQYAQCEAIAKEFGTLVNQSNTLVVKNKDGKSSEDFYSLSSTDVKGEWLETRGEPKYQIEYKDNELVITVTVKGVIREIVSASIDIKATLMREGQGGRKVATTDFNNGEDLYLQFTSPVEGYLAVYLLDKDNAYCLLPYMRDGSGKVKVKAGKQYLFFSPQAVPQAERAMVDEYTMTCSGDEDEFNKVYIIFSPNMFTKASDAEGGSNDHGLTLPRQLSFKDFNTWLTKNRRRDKNMMVVMENITIKK